MKKTVYTLNIDNYEPDIVAITYPFLHHYARKIDADFRVITERKFPNMPVTYEKLQVHELGKNNDWNIYIDSDALIHPDLFDITEHIHPSVVLTAKILQASSRTKYDNYFRRDGRSIWLSNWFTVSSRICHDLWLPMTDLTLRQALARMHPIRQEIITGNNKGHYLDEFVVSRNVARHALKVKIIHQLLDELGHGQSNFFMHDDTAARADKVQRLRETADEWRIPGI